MKIIRFYDDRRVVWSNVNWDEICSNDIKIEYCTFDDQKMNRFFQEKNSDSVEITNWDIDKDKEYFVFLDTKWTIPNTIKTMSFSESPIPEIIVSQLKMDCVKRVVVYSTIKPEMADNLILELKRINEITDKVYSESTEIPLYDQSKIKENILSKIN